MKKEKGKKECTKFQEKKTRIQKREKWEELDEKIAMEMDVEGSRGRRKEEKRKKKEKRRKRKKKRRRRKQRERTILSRVKR